MKKTKIKYFKNLSNYQISGGITHLNWDVENTFYVLLISGKSFRVFSKTKDLKVLTDRSEKYFLIALGLFSYSVKMIETNPIKLNHKTRVYGKLNSSEINIPRFKNESLNTVIESTSPRTTKIKVIEIRP
tara:strand:- start:24 stop:413 length:390 start_codon:yes stop_codon:yes gene_type:complete